MNAYLDFNPDTFRDKTVLLPCDDPEWSKFTRFFAADLLYYKRIILALLQTSELEARIDNCHE